MPLLLGEKISRDGELGATHTKRIKGRLERSTCREHTGLFLALMLPEHLGHLDLCRRRRPLAPAGAQRELVTKRKARATLLGNCSSSAATLLTGGCCALLAVYGLADG